MADPSAPDAFVRGIMEHKEWVMVEGSLDGEGDGYCTDRESKIQVLVNWRKKMEVFSSFLDKLSKI